MYNVENECSTIMHHKTIYCRSLSSLFCITLIYDSIIHSGLIQPLHFSNQKFNHSSYPLSAQKYNNNARAKDKSTRISHDAVCLLTLPPDQKSPITPYRNWPESPS